MDFHLIRRIPIFEPLPTGEEEDSRSGADAAGGGNGSVSGNGNGNRNGAGGDRRQARERERSGSGLGSGSDWTGLNMSAAGFHHLNSRLTMYADRLTVLDLSRNRLSSIDSNVFLALEALQRLDLSSNMLETLPREVGNLTKLSSLRLDSNMLIELPPETGRLLGQLTELSLKNNPSLQSPPHNVLARGLEETLRWLRERIQSSYTQPTRRWVPLPPTHAHEQPTRSHVVLCFNILAERYCTEKLYYYCPAWALAWEHRAQLIMQELLAYDADVLCLQEVEGDKYEALFKTEMENAGYDSVYSQKGRAQTMDAEERLRVDGCATFYKRSRYQLVDVHELNFTQMALTRDTEFMRGQDLQDSVSRLMRTDNVAHILILGERSDPARTLLLSNTHLHWNPMLSDVKLLQAQLLLERVEQLSRDTRSSVIICGDFNSEPSSAVFKLITTGRVMGTHTDLRGSKFGRYSEAGFRHGMKLSTCHFGPYTNVTTGYCGVLDYVFTTAYPLGYLAVLPREDVRVDVARPSIQAPSDHFSLVVKIGEK